MKKRNLLKWLLLVALVLIIFVIIIIRNKPSGSDARENIIIKENVIVFSDEVLEDDRPYSVEDNRLLFKNKPQVSIGDVLVSGITKEAPNGYIRKVMNIAEDNDVYICETEPATLLDVFEEVHFTETILLVGQEEYVANTYEVGKLLVMDGDFVSGVFPQSNQGFSVREDRDNDNLDDLVSIEFKGEVDEDIQIEGKAGIKIWLNVQLDIKNGHIDWEITANDRIHGKLLLGFSESAKKEFVKKLVEKELPSIQFMVGIIPVVITNEIRVQLEGECSLEGDVGTSMEIYETHTAGFQYSSKTDTLREINTQNFRSGGMNWSTGMGVKGSASAGVFVYLQSMLYDCAGANIAIGVEGKAEGEAKIGLHDAGKSAEPIGKITMSIYPQLKGNVVIDIPIICKDMKEIPLYEQSLSPFWSKTWSMEEQVVVQKPEEQVEELETNALKDIFSDNNQEEIWYEVYSEIISSITMVSRNTQGVLYFPESFFIERPEDGYYGGVSGGYSGAYENLVYYLRYNSKNDVPDLCLGTSYEGNVTLVAIYHYCGDGNSAASLASIDDYVCMAIGLCTNGGYMQQYYWGTHFYDEDYQEIEGTMDMVIDPNTLEWTPIEDW